MDDGALWAATTFCPIQRQNSSVLPYVVIVSRTETNKEPPELYRRRCLRRIVADVVLIGGYLLLHLADEDTKDTKVGRYRVPRCAWTSCDHSQAPQSPF